MILHCLATGSRGNCYILENQHGKALMLECGLRVKDIALSPAFTSWRNISACLISHGHADHNAYQTEIERNGINTYGYHNMQHGQSFEIADKDSHWKIKAFSTVHNADNPLGFIIKDYISNKTLAFVTDTVFMPTLTKIDCWLVECNYDQSTIGKQINKADTFEHLGNVLENHMGLEYLMEYFKRPKLQPPKAIIACHLSQTNASPARIMDWLSTVAQNFGIAEKGKEFNL